LRNLVYFIPSFRYLCRMQDKIAKYFSDKPEIAAVYLFGSYAQGTTRPLSDVDIAILLSEEQGKAGNCNRFDYMADLGRILGKDIHPVIMNSAGEELLRKIFTNGQCIQVNDEKALSEFRTVSFSKIAEFGYYRAQFQKGLIRKIREQAEDFAPKEEREKSSPESKDRSLK
jgi:uncharacterized protein